MVVIDATTLLLLVRPETPVPAGPGGSSVEKVQERIANLVQELDKAKVKIIIPTPALSEVLVRAGAEASQQIVEQLQKLSVFRIEPFDARAAIEVASMSREALRSGKKRGESTAVYAKVKYDRQIVAIAVVNGATTIYSDDGDIRTLATTRRLRVVSLSELPLPSEDAQLKMPFTELATPESGYGSW